MPYKTKFRRIEVPQTGAGLRAIGADANSVRSLGAAHYRQFATVYPLDVRHRVVEAVTDSSIRVLQAYFEEKKLPFSQRQIGYWLQGVQRSAGSAGDGQTVEYVSRRLAELK